MSRSAVLVVEVFVCATVVIAMAAVRKSTARNPPIRVLVILIV
jgi:hypothetical protein